MIFILTSLVPVKVQSIITSDYKCHFRQMHGAMEFLPATFITGKETRQEYNFYQLQSANFPDTAIQHLIYVSMWERFIVQ